MDVTWGLHVCHGNRYARPSWEGHDDFLFPAELISQRILKALETLPADKLVINPDCGLRHLPADVARSKLAAMVKGTVAVRRTLPHQSGHTQLAEPHDRTVTSPELTVEQGA